MRLKTHMYLPNDLIFLKGDVARELYFIRKGIINVFLEVDATRQSGDGRRTSNTASFKEYEYTGIVEGGIEVKLMGAGSFFGELALLTDMPRSCTVRSRTVAELSELNKFDFEDVMMEYPELNKEIVDQICQLYPDLKRRDISRFCSEEADYEQQVLNKQIVQSVSQGRPNSSDAGRRPSAAVRRSDSTIQRFARAARMRLGAELHGRRRRA